MSATARRVRPAIVAAFAGALVLGGCATTGERQVYVDWLKIANPDAVCNGQPDCVRLSTYAGKPRCTIVTGNRDVSYARLGERVRECLGGST